MAGQTPSRRQLVQALACASLASGAPGFVRWSFAFAEPGNSHDSAQAAPHHTHTAPHSVSHPKVYVPVFFTAPEYVTVELLAELILPRTGAPAAVSPAHTVRHATFRAKVSAADAGATDAGVAEFIDFMVAQDPKLHDPFRNGLLWINGASSPSAITSLDAAAQTALLTRLAFRRNFHPEDKPGQEFFALMRRYTVMGFYTTQIGLEQLDYPGLQFYGESPSVPKDGSLDRILHA